MIRSRIAGVGACVPPREISNEDLEQMMDTEADWILQRSGIRKRYWAEHDDTTSVSKLALPAVEEALKAAGVGKQELDLIIFATVTPDALFPGAGCYLQAHMGLPGIPALDIRQTCTGFLYALSIADAYIRAGIHRTVLVVGAEMQSKCLDVSTRGRDMTVLFGDGAGACIVQRTEVQDASPATSRESFLFSTHLHADGSHAKDLIWASPGTANRIWNPPELVSEENSFPQMRGRHVFTHAVKRMPEAALEALEANGVGIESVDLFVLHQANKRINDKFSQALGIAEEKVFSTIEDFGNTTAATIPLGLAEAVRRGRLVPGMLVLSAAFGGGFTWGSALYRW